MAGRKREIHQSGDEDCESHRGDFGTCPHCGHAMKYDRWKRIAYILCLRPRIYKEGCASIISECPKCFESSWVHLELDSVAYMSVPNSWKDAAKEESAAQKLAALRQWGESLCYKCKYLKTGRIGHYAFSTCCYHTGPAQTECSRYKPL